MDFTNISFPGMGIGAFRVNQLAFSIGALRIYWSTLILLAGAVLTFFYVAARGKKREGLTKIRTLILTAVAVALGVVIARGSYVVMTWDTVGYTRFGEVIAFWDGMTLGGALVGGLLGILIMSDVFKLNGLRMMDLFLPGMLLVQTIAAIGTFMDAPLFGSVIGETTSFYLVGGAVEFASGDGTLFGLIRMTLDKGGLVLAYHPVFFYKLLWNLIGFLIAHFALKRVRFSGQVVLFYFTWIGFGRAFLAGLNGPKVGIHSAQLLWLVIGVLALIAMIVRLVRAAKSGVKIEGSDALGRAYKRMMNPDEVEERRVSDIEHITDVLGQKADLVYENMTTANVVAEEEESTEA